MNRLKVLPIGTVSEGTLRTSDLIEAFLMAANALVLTREDRSKVTRIENRPPDWGEGEEGLDNLTEDMLELEDILAEYVPDYCYFGTVEGDGACYGVWPQIEQLEEEAQTGEIASSREKAHRAHQYAWEVNDHGNGTLWRRVGDKDQWKELWSVV